MLKAINKKLRLAVGLISMGESNRTIVAGVVRVLKVNIARNEHCIKGER